jgi:hypothetical protein
MCLQTKIFPMLLIDGKGKTAGNDIRFKKRIMIFPGAGPFSPHHFNYMYIFNFFDYIYILEMSITILYQENIKYG